MASKDLEKRLADILTEFGISNSNLTREALSGRLSSQQANDVAVSMGHDAHNKVLALFQDYALKLIGEDDTDEYDKTPYGNGWQEGRKVLRQQQRRTLGRKVEE